MSLLKVNEVQNYNGSSLTLTASTVSTSAQLNTGGNISVTGSINVSDDSTTRSNLGLGTMATQDSSNVSVTAGTLGSSVVFPTGHMVYREFQSEYQPNSQTGQTGTNVATTLSVTPLSTTSKFIFNIFGACSTGLSTVGYGGQVAVEPNYSLNSDMSSPTTGNIARANYFNSDSGISGQDLANSAGAFYSSTEFSHSGNTYYFNVDLTVDSGYRGYFRNINIQILEVF